jgi:hypothetical protein
VTQVKIETTESEIIKGKSLQLKAIVKGEGNPDTTVKWVILDPLNSKSNISDAGLLTIAESETATSLTIKAFSIQDTSISAKYQIKLILNPDLFMGKWTSEVDGVKRILEITNDHFSQTYLGGNWFYSVKDLKWTPTINEDPATRAEFPQGYLCNGVYDRVINIIDKQKNRLRTGVTTTIKLFMNKENTKFLRHFDNDPSGVIWNRNGD